MDAELRKCCYCGEMFPATTEYFHRLGVGEYLHAGCKTCRNKYWRDKFHDPNRHADILQKQKDRRLQLQLKVLTVYCKGEPYCQCCGERHIEFLSLDHVNGDGAEHRQEIGSGGSRIYRWAIKNDYPTSLQVLCANCNSAKGRYGYCPHERERD